METITKIKVNGTVYDIADKEAVEALERQLATEKQRAEEAERALGNAIASAARVDGNVFTATANEVTLTTTGVDTSKQYSVTLPAATTEKAGVMSAEDKKELDNIEQAITNAVERGKQLALSSLFVTAGAEYNDTDSVITKTAPWGDSVEHLPKHYYLNGLGDITEEQMVEIYNAGRVMQNVAGFYNSNKKIRTNLPSLHSTASGYSKNFEGRGMYFGCVMLEVAIISVSKSMYDKITASGLDAQFVFFNCPRVRYISKLDLEGGTQTSNMFKSCSSLSHVEIKRLSTSLSFSDSPLIDKESILCLIQNATPTSAITITLHADAFARLKDDAEIVAALESQPLITLVST